MVNQRELGEPSVGPAWHYRAKAPWAMGVMGAGAKMAEDGIPEDQDNGQSARRRHLFWRCGSYPFGSSRGAHLGQASGAGRHDHRCPSCHEPDFGDHLEGRMRDFMVKATGGVNADVFIEFLKRLLVGATRSIFLIVDRGPAHRAKKTKAFVATLGGQLKLLPAALRQIMSTKLGGRLARRPTPWAVWW